MTFVFKHPQYYKELRARNKSDQAISCAIGRRPSSGRAPGQGLKQQALDICRFMDYIGYKTWRVATETR